MTPEQQLTKQIMIWCGEHNWLCFHINTGGGELKTGGYFRTGTPVGFPDLTILTNNGRCIYCETKIHPRKPTQAQVNFINELKRRGFTAFVAYTLDEFIDNVIQFV